MTTQNGNSPWESYMTVGGATNVRKTLKNNYKTHLWVDGPLLDIETTP
jgi:hypothetical protein